MIRPLVLLACLAGCSPGAFDDRRSDAPSQSSGESDEISSNDYGAAIAPVITDRPGVHFAVLGRDPISLTTVSYDATGDLSLTGLDIEELAPNPGSDAALASSPEPIRGADGMVALGGLGSHATIYLFDGRTGDNGPQLRETLDASLCGGADLTNLGHAMTFGLTDLGAAAEPDLIALAGDQLVAFIDVKPGFTPTCVRCTLQAGQGSALAASDLGGEDGEEVILVAGGELFAFAGSRIEQHDRNTCFTLQTPQISGITVPDVPGTRIAIGQSGANGTDIAVSDPGGVEVTVVPGLTTSGPSGPNYVIAGDATAGLFGAALAFGDIDGDDADELIIGDPDASVDDHEAAGTAFVYELTGEGPELAARLHDSAPYATQRFARSLAIGEFVATDDDHDLLVAGAEDEVFTYFQALPQADDPRR